MYRRITDFLIVFFIAWISITIGKAVKASYEFESTIGCHWQLADKSSTIQAKSRHIDNFVNKWDRSMLSNTHNAIFYKTPNNSFNENYLALKTLQNRLHEMEKMDVNSFEYQAAIQQITAQEQGEAWDMLMVLKGCWYKENNILLWEWILGINIFLPIIILFILIIKRTKIK